MSAPPSSAAVITEPELQIPQGFYIEGGADVRGEGGNIEVSIGLEIGFAEDAIGALGYRLDPTHLEAVETIGEDVIVSGRAGLHAELVHEEGAEKERPHAIGVSAAGMDTQEERA
jgi:hypothetical protein